MSDTETIKAPALPYTVHPDLSVSYRWFGLVRYVLAALLMVFLFIRFGWVIGLLSTVVIGVIVFLVWFISTHRSIEVTKNGLTYKNAFGKTRTTSYGDIEVVRIFQQYSYYGTALLPRVIISTKTNKSFLSVLLLTWDAKYAGYMTLTLEEKKVPIELYDQVATNATIRKQFPGILLWHERHPVLFNMSLTLGVIILVVGIALGIVFLG
ncbi:hypothetical protein BGO18_00200 [Candidatus Saccharibacteria bacterium 47-87]|nr:hypothetical protein [Candidatus Saccharibacteria bacterium]OJU96606.1 MAG: hypothetical protein BGO18_00200 [Candidatus Saccharibacteria bacterium 47-87]